MSRSPSLADLLDRVERRRRTVTVFSPDRPAWVADLLGASHVAVEHQSISEDDVEPFLTVRARGEYLGSVRLTDLERLVSPRVPGLGAETLVEESHRRLREMLADTVFSAMDRRQLLGASREIEDRAWRVRAGELHAGFQSLSTMRAQREVYEALAELQNLSIHVYGRADWDPDVDGVVVHPTTDDALTDRWFVAFDGGDDPLQQCALVAEQHGDAYDGFWTYDPSIVEDLLAYLRSTTDGE
mgnify:CR=1 FL=1